MTNPIRVRAAERADMPAIRQIVDVTLFPGEMLDAMMAPYLESPETRHLWLVAEQGSAVCGVVYCEPERMTVGTWNMLAIAVAPDRQGLSIGSKLTHHLEGLLRERGERVLIVETSGLPDYERTRAFYRKHQYVEAACLKDFYADGEDKVIFWKSLTS